MKLIKILSAFAVAVALMTPPVFAQEKAPEHVQGACCKKAAEAGKECAHKCCVESAKKGLECEKCGGKGKIPPKKEEKK